MNALNRLITGGTVLLGAAALWHTGATVGTTIERPEASLSTSAEPAGLPSASADQDSRTTARSQRLAPRSAGLLDEELLEQHRQGRLLARSGRAARSLTPELTVKVLEIAEALEPEMALQLRALCDDDPREFERILHTSGRRLLALAELKKHEPVMFDLKFKELKNEAEIAHHAADLREAYRAGDESRIRVLTEELRRLAHTQIILTIALRADYLSRLKQHVEEVEHEIDHTVQNLDRLIQERLDAILEDARHSSQQDQRQIESGTVIPVGTGR